MWTYERWQTVFTGLLVLVGVVYTVAAVFQWVSMREQSRAMTQQLEIMKGDIENSKANRSDAKVK